MIDHNLYPINMIFNIIKVVEEIYDMNGLNYQNRYKMRSKYLDCISAIEK